MTTATLVIGGSGLLGSAILRQLGGQSPTIAHVRWRDPDSASADLAAAVDACLATPGASSFRLYWAAGAAVTSTAGSALDAEVAVFARFVDHFAARLGERRALLFFASSAGGVYSGSQRAPFDESTPPVPVSGYGRAKLVMEQALANAIAPTAAAAVIGRISTLYGPGQQLAKSQGFISHLCRAMLSRRPMPVYVSLDTLRDYIYADDAATIAIASVDALDASGLSGQAVVKNIASHASVTIGRVLQEARLVFKRRPTVALASSALAQGQVHDLRISSVIWPELNDIPRRSLVVGLSQTRAALEAQAQASGLN